MVGLVWNFPLGIRGPRTLPSPSAALPEIQSPFTGEVELVCSNALLLYTCPYTCTGQIPAPHLVGFLPERDWRRSLALSGKPLKCWRPSSHVLSPLVVLQTGEPCRLASPSDGSVGQAREGHGSGRDMRLPP